MKVRLVFPNAGVREVWAGPGWPESPPAAPEKLDGKAFEYALPAYGPEDRLFVLDASSGNLAAKPISEIKGTWEIAPAEFKRIGRLAVRIEHEGKPVAAANVTVSDGKRKLERMLDPSAKGVLTFAALEPGPIVVTVRYNTQGREADPLKQTVDIPLKRDKPVPTIVASLPEPVEVVPDATSNQTPATPATSGGGERPALPEPNPFGSAIVYLVVLAAVLAGGYYLLQLMRKNPEMVKDRLGKLGVDLPEPPDTAEDVDAGAAPVMRAPEPPQQILLGDAPPEPATPVPAPSTGEPQLVGADGRVLKIPEGLSVVGREEGLPFSLEGESTLSRRHAEFVREVGSVSVRDLGSTNGTFINGAKIDSEVVLKHGDDVQFGAVRFRYEG